MTKQADFCKYILGLVGRLETILQDEEERESPMTEVVRSRTGASRDNIKRGKDTLTMSNLVGTLDDLFTAAKRVELSAFDGTDPGGWLMRFELYSRVNQTPEESKIPLAQVSMKGTTIHWFTILMEVHWNLNWAVFKEELMHGAI
ncbi:Retrovirus-related Pol polyprotein from transposon 297 family [Sesbania bispinosa]|nr:Retrovirus-related Pol polyprotein from transposon 297 family [Sesbania bispinosa]